MTKILVLLTSILAVNLVLAQDIDTVAFETATDRVYIDTTQTNNLWQIGTPTKTVFNAAFAGSKAILTDTLSAYTAGNTSSFNLAFELYGGGPSIEFTHKFNTDTLGDGGYVEVSVDSGATWLVLTDTTFLDPQSWSQYPGLGPYGLFTTNFYGINDSLVNGKIGFSGNSNGWTTSSINFPCFAIKRSFMLMLRFTFVSDSMGNAGDGWMIDNIILQNLGGCSRLGENAVGLATIYPNPATEKAMVSLPQLKQVNNGVLNIFSVTGKNVLQHTFTGNNVELNTALLPKGIYQVTITEERTVIAQSKLIIN